MTVWITRVPDDQVAARRAAAAAGPLRGWRLAVKDNIDVAGLPTTAGCPDYAYRPEASAPCAAALESAGAVVVGKTNMDCFATGLTGTRSPYGPVAAFGHPATVAGGSSSGSAVAVASGEADIALGTDTAGSGRVPAAMNGVVGLKPTGGLIPIDGIVPACRTVDCVAILARTCADARLAVAAAVDAASARGGHLDATAALRRPAALRAGVPAERDLALLAPEDAALFAAAADRVAGLGAELVEVDLAAFHAAGDLLYGGPWVAERLASVGDFLRERPDAAVDPIVRRIILDAASLSAVDAYRGRYALDEAIAAARPTWRAVDVLLLPTVPFAPTLDEVAADPVGVNTALGTFTRFTNLMDLCALAVPAGRRPSGTPFGVQLVAPALGDLALLELGERLERRTRRVAVAGAHLTGQPLAHQLTGRGGRPAAAARTAPEYRLYDLPGSTPPMPGLVRVAEGGSSIEVEVWELGERELGAFLAEVPPPLALGTLRLDDGEEVTGIVCEPIAVEGARDITSFGGWRAYLAAG